MTKIIHDKKNYHKKQKKLNMLFGLSLVQEQETITCPDEEVITAYFDNQLSADEEKNFLALLNKCPKSYSMWISMLETLGHSTGVSTPIADYQQESGIFQKLYHWFSFNQMSLTGALATVFLFVMVINISYTPFSQLPIDKQIVKVWKESEVLDLAYVDITEFTSMAATKSSFSIMPFPEKVAFSSGFKQGLINMSSLSESVKSDSRTLKFLNSLPNEPLQCNEYSCEKETWLNKQLGVWSSFALQECQQEKPSQANYWDKQSIVIKHFLDTYQDLNTNFKQKQANSLVKKVGTIDQSLQKLVSSETANKQSNQLIACNNIKQLTMYSIQGL
jgi:hypothetical protein